MAQCFDSSSIRSAQAPDYDNDEYPGTSAKTRLRTYLRQAGAHPARPEPALGRQACRRVSFRWWGRGSSLIWQTLSAILDKPGKIYACQAHSVCRILFHNAASNLWKVLPANHFRTRHAHVRAAQTQQCVCQFPSWLSPVQYLRL